MNDELLGPQALQGHRIAISVSESADLARLGLLEGHFRLALGEIARIVLSAGGSFAYGGHLKPDGYTPFLVQELRRWEIPRREARRAEGARSESDPIAANRSEIGERPRSNRMQICLAWSVHRSTPMPELRAFEREHRAWVDFVYLDPDGNQVRRPTGHRDALGLSDADKAKALTGMREYMTGQTNARVLLGGKRTHFSGRIPGLMEEAHLALEAGHAVYLAGGLGGATADIARAVGVDGGAAPALERYETLPDFHDYQSRYGEGIAELKELVGDGGWRRLNNSLTEQENIQLAATPRPSEIASLVALGVGRLAAKGDLRRVTTPD